MLFSGIFGAALFCWLVPPMRLRHALGTTTRWWEWRVYIVGRWLPIELAPFGRARGPHVSIGRSPRSTAIGTTAGGIAGVAVLVGEMVGAEAVIVLPELLLAGAATGGIVHGAICMKAVRDRRAGQGEYVAAGAAAGGMVSVVVYVSQSPNLGEASFDLSIGLFPWGVLTAFAVVGAAGGWVAYRVFGR